LRLLDESGSRYELTLDLEKRESLAPASNWLIVQDKITGTNTYTLTDP